MEEMIIDWELSQKIAGNNLEYAKEFLTLFIQNLPRDLEKIKQSYDTKNFEEMKKHIHKLLGGLSYCGVPQLKNATLRLDDTLKKENHHEIPLLFTQFETETEKILKFVGK